MSKDEIYSQIEASGKLPALPEVLFSLLAICDDPDSSIGDIAAVIERDPSLSLRVLQLVNSAYYGFRHNFSAIEQAAVYLGADTIKNLAITSSIHQVFGQKKQNGDDSFDTAAFWYHSLMCGTIARRIALETETGNSDEAYLAGLLHDIGKPFLAFAFSQSYTVPADEGLSSAERLGVEYAQTGINHSEAGSWLVRHWNLGSLVADAIEYHHESVEEVREAFPLVKIVYLANILAREEGVDQLDDLVSSLFGSTDFCDYKMLVATGGEEVDEIAASMGIRIRSTRSQLSESTSHGHEIGTDDTLEPSRREPAESINDLMAAKVRNISLLSTFQDDLLQVEGVEGVLSAFERAVNIQLGLDKVMFFLPETDGLLLRCATSTSSSLHDLAGGLTFPVTQSSSRIVKAFNEMGLEDYITREQQGSIADQQILTLLKCAKGFLIPLVADKQGVGVILIGFSERFKQLPEEESRLLRIIAQQVALRLHLEQEKIRKAEALEKARNEAISTAARKLAHEINNPLGIISNYLVTLKLKLTDVDSVNEEMNIIDEEIQRISQMVSQMESFSQPPSYQYSPIDINSLVKDIIQIVKPSLFYRSGLTISFIPTTDIGAVTTSKDGLKQIVINLLKNAAEALEEGGRVIVRIRRAHSRDDEEDGVELIIADSGPGLPAQVQNNLYKPFVTTKQNGHSGLGLSIVKRIVTDLGGKLSCVTSPEEGTSFTIFLPYAISEKNKAIRG